MKSGLVLFVAVLLTEVRVSIPLGPDDQAKCSAYPDPHYVTFDQTHYDYHGECDQVLIKNPAFAAGVGLYLHIRTRRHENQKWSRITNVALRINNDILEVKDDNHIYVDGILDPLPLPSTIGFYALSKSTSGTSTIYKVDLDPGNVTVTHTPSNYLRVDVRAEGEEFLESVGLCGTWTTPGMIGRDGGTDFSPNGNEFGKDWQVRNTEPFLFQPAPDSSPQYPEPCGAAPDVTIEFADQAKVEKAKSTCKKVIGPDFENCVFDVVVTEDRNWVENYKQADKPIQCVEQGAKCTDNGGECVRICNGRSHHCFPDLCCLPMKIADEPCDCQCAVRRLVRVNPEKTPKKKIKKAPKKKIKKAPRKKRVKTQKDEDGI